MATHRYSCSYEYDDDDDYIDIEIFSSPNFFCYSITSPSPTRDFEFQMCQYPLDHKLPQISPADQLFYQGKLLPLHLPPRLQMLQNLIQNQSANSFDSSFLFNYSPTKFSDLPTAKAVGNPSVNPNDCLFEFNPSVNPNDCIFELSAEIHSFVNCHPFKKSKWTHKLKPSLLARKIKASTCYLKSLFTKSGDEFSCKKAAAIDHGYFDDLRYMKVSKKGPFKVHEGSYNRRKSKLLISSSCSSSNSSSSTFSFGSSNELDVMKRCGSCKISNFEVEKSIEGAIAYCKKSYEQKVCSTEVRVSSMAVSVVG